METVLIADDEENIREGIKLIIDWEELGFEVIGDASNGEEALSLIQKLNPTLVVMDMQMPKIHGIDVIKQARQLGFEGYFIILSGYSDFSYARDAIRNRVTNYITKPVDEDELLDTVNRIKEEIENTKKEGGRIGKMRNKAKSVVVNELLMGNFTEQEDELKAMNLIYPLYQVVIHETYHTGNEKTRYKLNDLLKAILDEESYEVTSIEGNDCILIKGKAAISRFEDFILHYKGSPIETDSPLDAIFIALGSKQEDPKDICISYEKAKALAGRRFFCEEGQHFVKAEESEPGDSFDNGHKQGKRDIEASEKASQNEAQQTADKELQAVITYKIMTAVIDGNRNAMINALLEMSDYLKSIQIGSSDVCLFVTEILLQIKDRLSKQYPKLTDLFDSHAGIIEFIESRFYLYEIIQYFTDILDNVMNRLHDRQGSENVIEDIISYTDRNYAQQLTLEDLAAKFGYNSGYLGRLFTKTTGSGYNYYLNECRIKKAKEFLSEGKYKVYEVAQLVGYNDVDYFGKKFRKHAGMTPAEYKNISRRDHELER